MSEQIINLDQVAPHQRDVFFRQHYEDLEPEKELIFLVGQDPEEFLKSVSLSESEKYSYQVEKVGSSEWKVSIKRKKESCCGFCGGE